MLYVTIEGLNITISKFSSTFDTYILIIFFSDYERNHMTSMELPNEQKTTRSSQYCKSLRY